MYVSRVGLNYKGCVGKCEYLDFLVQILYSVLFVYDEHIYYNILWNVQWMCCSLLLFIYDEF